MYPHGLFGLDPLRLLLSPIALFGTAFCILYLRQEGVRALRALLLLSCIALLALLGAKLFSLHVRGWELFSPLSAELRGGMRYPGALIAMVLLGPPLQRRILPELAVTRFLDVLAITLCFVLALVRLSCLMSGCCTGPQCEAFYCLSYQPGSQVWYSHFSQGLLGAAAHPSHPVLPLHLLFMTASLGVGLWLLWYDRRRRFNGQIALLYLVLHEGSKGLLEGLREPYVLSLQLTSLLLSAAGLIVLLLVLRRQRIAVGRDSREQTLTNTIDNHSHSR